MNEPNDLKQLMHSARDIENEHDLDKRTGLHAHVKGVGVDRDTTSRQGESGPPQDMWGQWKGVQVEMGAWLNAKPSMRTARLRGPRQRVMCPASPGTIAAGEM